MLWKADFQDGEAEEQELRISQARETRRHALEESSRQFISFIVALQESIKNFYSTRRFCFIFICNQERQSSYKLVCLHTSVYTHAIGFFHVLWTVSMSWRPKRWHWKALQRCSRSRNNESEQTSLESLDGSRAIGPASVSFLFSLRFS